MILPRINLVSITRRFLRPILKCFFAGTPDESDGGSIFEGSVEPHEGINVYENDPECVVKKNLPVVSGAEDGAIEALEWTVTCENGHEIGSDSDFDTASMSSLRTFYSCMSRGSLKEKQVDENDQKDEQSAAEGVETKNPTNRKYSRTDNVHYDRASDWEEYAPTSMYELPAAASARPAATDLEKDRQVNINNLLGKKWPDRTRPFCKLDDTVYRNVHMTEVMGHKREPCESPVPYEFCKGCRLNARGDFVQYVHFVREDLLSSRSSHFCKHRLK